MTFKAVPRSKATNAYDLLNDVARAITEEPRRINMRWWTFFFQGEALNNWANQLHQEDLPACGTVGCIAGWCCFLTRFSGLL